MRGVHTLNIKDKLSDESIHRINSSICAKDATLFTNVYYDIGSTSFTDNDYSFSKAEAL